MPETSPVGKLDLAKVRVSPLELMAVNVTVPALFISASVDRET